jgi:hypothetical protein
VLCYFFNREEVFQIKCQKISHYNYCKILKIIIENIVVLSIV